MAAATPSRDKLTLLKFILSNHLKLFLQDKVNHTLKVPITLRGKKGTAAK